MGANIVRRLMRDGHECVVYDISAAAVQALEAEGAVAATSLADLASKLEQTRAVWIMVPAGDITTKTVDGLAAVLGAGDAIIDGGNSHYYDDLARAASLREAGVHYIDVGTSGGVWGLDRGYCLMIGGDTEVVDRLNPIWASVAPGVEAAPPYSRSRRRRVGGRTWLPPLRPGWGRALRQDGAQRDRVRAHGRVRRGT